MAAGIPDEVDEFNSRGFRTFGLPSMNKLPNENTVPIVFGEHAQGQTGLVIGSPDHAGNGNPLTIDEMRGRNLIATICGGSSSFFFSEEGKIYVCGSNRSFELGLRAEVAQVPTPKLFKFMRSHILMHLASSPARTGECHSLVLNDEGEVYSYGASTCGALGQGQEVRKCYPTILQITNAVQVKQVACGRQHSLMLTNAGDVFSFGCHGRGQCGLGPGAGVGPRNAVYAPHIIQAFTALRVRKIFCGDEHNIAVVQGTKESDYIPTASASGTGTGRNSSAGSGSISRTYFSFSSN